MKMKKTILFLLLTLTLVFTGCKFSKNNNAVAVSDSFIVPDAADVVLYQVNPRVFAPSNSLQAVLARIDSIEDLGINMIWIMPIYPIGEEKTKNSHTRCVTTKPWLPNSAPSMTCACW